MEIMIPLPSLPDCAENPGRKNIQRRYIFKALYKDKGSLLIV